MLLRSTVSAAGARDAWESDPSVVRPDPTPPDDGSPMGLNMDPSEQPALQPSPGPGAEVPKLLVLLSTGVLLWLLKSFGARAGRRLYAIRWPMPRLALPRRAPAPVSVWRPEWDDFHDPYQDAPWRKGMN